MSRDDRTDAGRFTETVSVDDVLGVFEAVEGPVVTSGDVAETLDCSRETARRKLRALENRGHVASRETAGRIVWWLAEDLDATHGVDADDPFWDLEPGASGETAVSETVDAVLYGDDAA
jgi:hypothetical protein